MRPEVGEVRMHVPGQIKVILDHDGTAVRCLIIGSDGTRSRKTLVATGFVDAEIEVDQLLRAAGFEPDCGGWSKGKHRGCRERSFIPPV